MRKLLLNLSLLTLFACTSAPTNNDALIHFYNKEFNFGIVPYKKDAEFNFEFTNPGKTPLIIFNVETSCGCTVADWTKNLVKPGVKGIIKINYDADFPGTFNKTITVHFNGEDSPITLHIKGQVEYPEDFERGTE